MIVVLRGSPAVRAMRSMRNWKGADLPQRFDLLEHEGNTQRVKTFLAVPGTVGA